jgi:CheY-like chemotaxis protein
MPVPTTSTPRLGGAPTILLADDEPTPLAEAARLVRGGLGCHVCEARDGRQAFRVFRQHPGKSRLALTDFITPLMDGGELAERIRDLDPKVPIVLMSASPTEQPCWRERTRPRRTPRKSISGLCREMSFRSAARRQVVQPAPLPCFNCYRRSTSRGLKDTRPLRSTDSGAVPGSL